MRIFQNITRVLRFDDRTTRAGHRQTDKFAPIRDLFYKWVENLAYIYVPLENVTVDEQSLSFRGRCPFRQYMPSKPAKYGIKSSILADSKTFFVYKMQPYLGKLPGERTLCKAEM